MEYHPLMCEILDSRPSSILENNGCDTLDIEHLNGEWNEEYLNDNTDEHNSDFDLPSTSAFLNSQNNADETNWELGIDDLPSTSTSSNTTTTQIRLDRSKGRGSYAKALSSFHESWSRECKIMISRQEKFFSEEAEKQREWETKMLEEQRKHNENLVRSSNETIESAIRGLIASQNLN
ncbi:uncharacterized protein LOC119675862 [Teleopsis dalmanni]|uniref:uncharacterized protein LOC119675862 n=1 Tax=Teleopsis dalmanni TaxID=139649 RepID=UPI0018CDB0A6|nr:uncharacterized protein LOC119675862 [Teleopsis dalmanni]